MPTKRKRYIVTETDEVGDVLRRVADALGTAPDIGELVVLGGEEKLRRVAAERNESRRRLELRQRFLERTRTGHGIDVQALREVREHGWSHE